VDPDALDPRTCRIISDLSLLFEISQTLETSLDVRKVIRPALKRMATTMGLQRGTVTIVNRDTSEITVDETCGLPEGSGDLYSRAVKPLLARVIESGEPFVARDVTTNEHFRGLVAPKRPENKDEIVTSFLCVPIRLEQESLGTLSVERLTRPGDTFEHDLRMLTIIATVIAQAQRKTA
jgi:Nif-specific regulatory protein